MNMPIPNSLNKSSGAVAGQYLRRSTQPARLLAYLLNGARVDPLAAWHRLGIYRLSDTVLQLRKLGWPLITGDGKANNRFGERCRFAVYCLPVDSVSAAGDFAESEYSRMAQRRVA